MKQGAVLKAEALPRDANEWITRAEHYWVCWYYYYYYYYYYYTCTGYHHQPDQLICPYTSKKHQKEHEERKHLMYSHDRLDMGWRIATKAAEESEGKEDLLPSSSTLFNATQMENMMAWFEDGGE